MVKNRRLCLNWMLVVIMGGLLSGCGSRSKRAERNVSEQEKHYAQGFKSSAMWIVLEWAGKPHGYGSGFLIDKKNGIFATNKHVSRVFNALGKGSHKIFFNGRVYNAEVIKTCALVDAGIARITDPFDPSEFPDPSPLSKQPIKVGDKVAAEGFHPHPYLVREKDRAAGRDYSLIPIYKEYYNLGTRNIEKEIEVVLEKLTGRVTEVNVQAELDRDSQELAQDLKHQYNLYAEVKVDWDHQFSFGGLSGSAVRNEKREIIGILTAERRFKKVGNELIPIHDIILITPVTAIDVLEPYVKKDQ